MIDWDKIVAACLEACVQDSKYWQGDNPKRTGD